MPHLPAAQRGIALEWHERADDGAAAGLGEHVAVAAEQGRPLAHAEDAQVAPHLRSGAGLVEAASVGLPVVAPNAIELHPILGFTRLTG